MNHETGLGATYTYNGLGHRVGKVEGNTLEPSLPTVRLEEMRMNPTKQIDDVLDMTQQYHNLLQRHEDNNATSFLWDNNILSAVGEDESHLLYFRDDLGSPIRLRDTDGREREVYGYDEFGNDLYNNQSIGQPFGYTGYQGDKVANTYFAQSREYRPTEGRFVDRDIRKGFIEIPLTMNNYSYCFNSPVVFVDKTGSWPAWLEELVDNVMDGAKAVITTSIDVLEEMGYQALGGVSYLIRESGINKDFDISTADVGGALLMMNKDENGIFHADFNCWQQIAGYSDLYDFGFSMGTSANHAKFDFEYDGEDYIFWAWKADYINMGAGAEMGIYRRLVAYGNKTEHWLVDKDLALPMTVTLKDIYGNTIIEPYREKHWWITGFNPKYRNMQAEELIAIYTVEFADNKGMFKAFFDKYGDKNSRWRDERWTFDKDKFTATLTFASEGMENKCLD